MPGRAASRLDDHKGRAPPVEFDAARAVSSWGARLAQKSPASRPGSIVARVRPACFGSSCFGSSYFSSSGTLPPLAASLAMTCLCSQMFILAESCMSPV